MRSYRSLQDLPDLPHPSPAGLGNRLLPRRPVGGWRCCLGFGEEREGAEYLGSWAAAVKTGTFPHESQTLFSLSFTRGVGGKATATWVTAARGQQSATFKKRAEARRHPEHQPGLTAKFVISSRKKEGLVLVTHASK